MILYESKFTRYKIKDNFSSLRVLSWYDEYREFYFTRTGSKTVFLFSPPTPRPHRPTCFVPTQPHSHPPSLFTRQRFLSGCWTNLKKKDDRLRPPNQHRVGEGARLGSQCHTQGRRRRDRDQVRKLHLAVEKAEGSSAFSASVDAPPVANRSSPCCECRVLTGARISPSSYRLRNTSTQSECSHQFIHALTFYAEKNK